MRDRVGEMVRRDELVDVIRRVRRRWRLRIALRGVAIVLGALVLVVLASAYGMEYFRFSPPAIVAFRILVYAGAVALLARYLALPLLRRVPDERVALYVEEHEPSLEAALLSAVEAGGAAQAGRSPALTRRLVETAAERARAIDSGRRIERPALRRGAGVVAGVVAAGALAIALGPAFVRTGARLLFWPSQTAEAATPYSIAVEPGNANVARGADLAITARLRGFSAEGASLAVRRGAGSAWEQIPMAAGREAGEYTVRLFDLNAPTEYAVESNGVRSPAFRISVSDLPYVRRIDLEYRFPAYTGLAPDTVEDGGDIAAPRGTSVLVRATPTMPVRGGRIIVEGGDTVALAVGAGGVLEGALRVDRNGFYKIELESADAGIVPGSLDYTIDALADRPPTVAFENPGRDLKVTRVEEVFTAVEAEDDYGVRSVELVYSVNGAPERSVNLYRSPAGGRKELSAGHTFFLEELPLVPGDFVSYYARARDGSGAGAAQVATTDIYFMQVRPFGTEYRQAEQGGGGGGGGGGEPPNALSERQRQIIAATFNAVRDRTRTSDREYRENLATLALAQEKLRQQVDELAQRLLERGAAADSSLRTIAEALPRATAEMRAAEERLGKREAQGALPPEQRALQQLQRAEAAFREVQVSFGGGGGGGGGGESRAEDLADLFELETDKLRNQYESVQRGEQQAADGAVDETLERLRELANRQQRENERMRRGMEQLRSQAGNGGGSGGGESGGGASGGASSGGGGGESQRQLAEETERLARQLERLSRDNPSPELRDGARRLQDAAAEMRRSASAAGAGAQRGASALDRLREAQRLLNENRAGRTERDVRAAQRQAAALAEEQRAVAAEAERVARAGGGAGREAEALGGRKDSLAAGLTALERQLDRVARDARREQPDAARRLQEAAGSIREERLREKIRFSKDAARAGASEYAQQIETEITAGLDDVRRKVDAAAGALREPEGRQVGQSLERARELARGLESLGERVRQRREEGAGGGEPGGSAQGREGGRQGAEGGEGGSAEGAQGGQGGQGGQGATGARGRSRMPGSQGGGGQGVSIGGGSLSAEDARQFGREFRSRREDAEELRRSLSRQGVDVRELAPLIARMRELENARVYDDAEEVERLQAAVVDGLKAFEFALRRRVEGAEGERPRLGGSDEVPAGFRELVEEYYRSLARPERP